MKALFKVKNCTVEVTLSEIQVADGKFRPHLRGNVYPFMDRFHCVRFEVCDKETEIGFGGNSFKNGMGAKMVEAAVIAQEQVNHFSSLLEEMQSCKGNPTPVIEAMNEGNYAMAGIMLAMIPDAEEEVLQNLFKRKLPEGSKAVSVVTAVMLEPSFKPVFAMLGKSTEEMKKLNEKEFECYYFAKQVRNLYSFSPSSEDLDAYSFGEERIAFLTEKMKALVVGE